MVTPETQTKIAQIDKQIEELMTKAVNNIDEIKDMYNHREIEK